MSKDPSIEDEDLLLLMDELQEAISQASQKEAAEKKMAEPKAEVETKVEESSKPEPEPELPKTPTFDEELDVSALTSMTEQTFEVKPPVSVEPEAPAKLKTTKRATPVETASRKYYIDPAEFQLQTAINPSNLDDAFVKQNSLRAYYGTQAAFAEGAASRAKARFEVSEADLYDTHRRRLSALSEKVTEKMVENAVKTDPRWIEAKNEMIDAETTASLNKAMAASLMDRRDMLIQLGADRRDEMKGQMRMMESAEMPLVAKLRQQSSTEVS